MTVVDLRDFSGLNTRDAAEQVAQNETPDALNMILTTRGAVIPRNGCALAVTIPGSVDEAVTGYYSPALDKWFLQIATTVYVRAGGLTGSWTSHITLGSTSAAAFCDFAGLVVVVEATQVWTTDGTTATSRSTTVQGSCVAVFENRVWVAGDSANKTRVWFSDLGSATAWTTATGFLDIRMKDDQILTALAGAPGALLAFKKKSAYRITSTSTYQTIDGTNGAAGARAVASLGGKTYTWGDGGIYEWDGIGRGVNVADQVAPFFNPEEGERGPYYADVVAAAHKNRVFFAYPEVAQSAGGFAANLTHILEYDPLRGTVVNHKLASNEEFAVIVAKGERLYGVLKTATNMYEMFSGTPGADNGVNYTSYYKTPALNLGRLHRLQKARVYGKAASAGTNTKELRTYKDWSTSVADTFDITTDLETADGEEAVTLRSLGHAEAFQLEFRVSGGTGTAELDRLLLTLDPLAR